jgi:hypothetical protein
MVDHSDVDHSDNDKLRPRKTSTLSRSVPWRFLSQLTSSTDVSGYEIASVTASGPSAIEHGQVGATGDHRRGGDRGSEGPT